MAFAAAPASAQVQRTFVNLGFEDPDVGGTCHTLIAADQVPGWDTTHPPTSFDNHGCTITPSPPFGPLIELWRGDQGVIARAGSQHAELNAREPSRIYQNVCLANGETVSWRLSHRGRESSTVPDVMQFGLSPSGSTGTPPSTVVATIGGTNNGLDRVDTSGTPSSANIGTMAISVASGGWVDYNGSFVYTGPTSMQQLGFAALSTGSGSLDKGNFLDDIQVTLRPFLELTTSTLSVIEGNTTPNVQIRLMGSVPAGGLTVPFTVSGTATSGSDFTAGASVSVPAGEYDNNTFTLPLTIIDDSVIENNETIIITLQANPSIYTIGSTTTCGTAGVASQTLILLDTDVDVRTTMSVINPNPPANGSTTFTVTFQNNTAAPTVGSGTDFDAHNATVRIRDPLPSGFSALSWTCSPTGSASCPASSGTGPIDVTLSLPAGAGAAGGTLTYSIVGTLASGTCTSVTNSSTIEIAQTLWTEGTSAQAGFTTPAPGGTANNTASASVDPGCLTLNKSVLPAQAAGPFPFTLTNTLQSAGTATTPAGGTVQVDGSSTAGTQPFGISTVGTAVTITEGTPASNFALSSATCTGPSGAVGSRSGSTFTLPAASVTAGADFTCTFTNTSSADLRITNTNTPIVGPDDQASDTVTRGQSVTYSIFVHNAGPATVSGAIVRGTMSNLNCPASTVVDCTSGGCPGSTIATLTGPTGISLSPISAGNAISLTYSCTVP